MDKDKVKKFIAEKVSAGISLSKIQDMLQAELGVKTTFMELRLLASELESVDWSKTDKPEPKAPPKAPAPAKLPAQDEAGLPQEEALEDELPAQDEPATEQAAPTGPRGVTKVELNKLVKPGMLACGSVQFGSGASANWFVDQYGRLGLDKATGKPDQKDVEEFQAELQKIFAQQGL